MRTSDAASSPNAWRDKAAGGLLERPAAVCTLVLFGAAIFLWPQLPFIDATLHLTLPDSDDALRLQGVRDLLAGQSLFDNTQYRYLPPAGASLHWSRFVDAPLAALIWALTPFLGARLAEGAVAAFWPVGLFFLYLAVLGFVAWRAFGLAAVGFAALVAGQMFIFGDVFGAGRIDHHNIEVVLILAAAGCFAFAERSWRVAALGGALAGLSLAVSLEALPFVAVLALLHALVWAFGDRRADGSFMGFAAALALSTLLAFGLQIAPANWLAPACDALSVPWLLLTAGGALAALALTQAGSVLASSHARLAALAAAGALIAGTFVSLFPVCLGGPYHMVPEPLRTQWLDAIPEANSLRQILLRNPGPTLQCFGPLLVAAGVAGFAAWRTEGRQRRMMTVLAAMLWTGVLLCLVQIRVAYVVSAFIPLAAGWVFMRLARLVQPSANPAHTLALLGVAVLLLGAPWSVGFNLARAGTPFAPAPISAIERGCLTDRYIQPLDQLPKGLVLAPMELGPHLIFLTHHSIIAAGYHRNVDGIIAGIEAFTGSEADMRRHAERFAADYVVICPAWVALTKGTPFARDLVDGKTVSWLEPLAVPGPLKVWRVRGQ
jgi:hypothetical protein